MAEQTDVVDVGDQARAELADLIDRQMSPLGLAAMHALAPEPGHTVLDVGCGAGQTILQLADRVGPSGRIIGVDLAPRVLAVARRRTAHLPQVELLQQDAGALPLASQSLDRVFSRFGTMFFTSPVAAFANMRRMLRPGGRVAFVCWRSMHENELDVFCVEAAGLPINVDVSPFSFESAAAVEQVLGLAGFYEIKVSAYDAQISCGDVEATLKVVTRVGALGKALRENPALLADAEEPVRAALTAREQSGSVHLGAATWIVVATA
ncbi:SAM-dependent methyltransferase [Novosphingobium chloroacetimidivorans]|uniref:SAM-dependent methyltransferase n=1 Tax=Novosphingobium chloroacetimidivorans TaxID=1428314 RepID=A0A7W7NVZ8_9SPHN|nr:class I SAM-dependent methyltransferase [Novosphingobium chloroacetimidivorans]MBB4859013.1 SAM-dependent methyltransferase [Novosphingobium chloroacetimidivorans]